MRPEEMASSLTQLTVPAAAEGVVDLPEAALLVVSMAAGVAAEAFRELREAPVRLG